MPRQTAPRSEIRETTIRRSLREALLAGDATARAIMRGVYEAEPLAGIPSYREQHGSG